MRKAPKQTGPPRDRLEPVFDARACSFCGDVIPQANHARRRRRGAATYYFHPACPPRFKAKQPLDA